jgi:hypothetical protein
MNINFNLGKDTTSDDDDSDDSYPSKKHKNKPPAQKQNGLVKKLALYIEKNRWLFEQVNPDLLKSGEGSFHVL